MCTCAGKEKCCVTYHSCCLNFVSRQMRPRSYFSLIKQSNSFPRPFKLDGLDCDESPVNKVRFLP